MDKGRLFIVSAPTAADNVNCCRRDSDQEDIIWRQLELEA